MKKIRYDYILVMMTRCKCRICFKTRFVCWLFWHILTFFDLLFASGVLNLSFWIVIKSLDGYIFYKRYEIWNFTTLFCHPVDISHSSSWWKIQLVPTVSSTVFSDPSFYNMMKIPSLSMLQKSDSQIILKILEFHSEILHSQN